MWIDDSYGYEDSFGDDAEFYFPKGLAIDGVGDIFVADRDNDSIRKVTPAGDVATYLEGAGGTHPQGIALDASGALYVATGSHYIYRIQ